MKLDYKNLGCKVFTPGDFLNLNYVKEIIDKKVEKARVKWVKA